MTLGLEIERGHVDKGYRGHTYENKFKIWITDQKQRLSPTIKREMKRRSAIEPVIGHVKSEHRMGRNYLAHRQGDQLNPVLAAVGFNFHLLLRWFLRLLLCLILGRPVVA